MAWLVLGTGEAAVPAEMSIRKGGRISWNLAAQTALGNPKYVDILVDVERNLLGIRKARSGSAKVTRDRKRNHWLISALVTLRQARLLVERPHHRPASLDGDILYIPLDALGETQ